MLTEGAVTEPSYLAQWARRNRRVHVEFAESGMAPLSLVQRAREYQLANRRPRRGGRGIDFEKRLDPKNIDALLAGYEAARQRAQHLHERHLANGSDASENPSSNVWELIDRLR